MKTKIKENRLNQRTVSRNGELAKSSTTVLRLSAGTPFKVMQQDINTSKITISRAKQILTLRKENAELLQLLKRSKRSFIAESESKKQVIQTMNSALNVVLPIIETHGDNITKRKIKEVLFKRYTDTEQQHAHPKEQCKKIKEQLLNIEEEIIQARNELTKLKGENECFRRYISYSKEGTAIPTFIKTVISFH